MSKYMYLTIYYINAQQILLIGSNVENHNWQTVGRFLGHTHVLGKMEVQVNYVLLLDINGLVPKMSAF